MNSAMGLKRCSSEGVDRPRTADALPGLTIVLPCLNEEDNIAEAVRLAGIAAQHCADRYEIVVIDDGSADDTAVIAGRIAARDPHVRLVMHATNRGYGDAVRSGISAARMPWLLLTDADLQFDFDQLEAFLPTARTADVIVGWRRDRQDPWHRRVNAAGWNWLMHRLFDLPVRDVDCAFKLVRTDLAQRASLSSGGAMVSAELIVRCMAAGAVVREQGVRHLPRVAGRSSGANVHVIIRAFRELTALRRDLQAASSRAA